MRAKFSQKASLKISMLGALSLVIAANSSIAVSAAPVAKSKTDAPVAQTTKSAPTTSNSSKDKFEKAYIYGFPMVMLYDIIYQFAIDKSSPQFKGPLNQLVNESRVFTYKDTTVITPNSDTPYSTVIMDLRAEPLVLTVPEIEKKRYYDIQLTDLYTFNYGYIGSRATGNGAASYLVAGPDWNGKTPAGIKKVFRCATQLGMAIYRTQLFGPDDMPNVVAVQSGYKVQPLSAFLKQAAPTPSPEIKWLPASKDSLKAEFPAYLNFVLQFCPTAKEDKALRDEIKTVGIEPGKAFDFASLSADDKEALGAAIKDGYAQIKNCKNTVAPPINGWLVASVAGNRDFFEGNWLLRAFAADAGILANSAEEAVYPMAKTDNNGDALDGSKHNYSITFGPDQMPPVNAFWSITMYDAKQLLIENPINRYLINSPMLPGMKKNKDGGLTIYIQKDAPEADKMTNWLPAPNGPIYMVMRLYWPKTGKPSILPPGQGSWKPPVIQVVQ